MSVRYFEDLEVWKEARTLTDEIYKAAQSPVFSTDFGLRDQMERAAVSVMSNIAEGFLKGTGYFFHSVSLNPLGSSIDWPYNPPFQIPDTLTEPGVPLF